MTDTTDTTTTAPPTAFCQNCGTALTPATTRTVGPATYCEPCLDAKLHGGPQAARPPYPGTPLYPRVPSVPNPGTAALLGLIPGVGAMYNEQYAKGIIHLIVFAVLIVLAGDVNGIFGIFIAGWVCYMVIEAHHTARARRDHTPLPNPFGLNDVAERLGFGKAWPSGAPNVASVLHDAANAAAHAAQQFQQQAHYQPQQPWPPVTPPAPEPIPTPTHFGDWATPTNNQYTQTPPYADPATQQPWRDTYATAPPPGTTPFSNIPGAGAPIPMPTITGHHRFPAGAIWLIGAGVFFLFATSGIFHAFRGEIVVGLGLIALAVWLFMRRMLESGPTLAGDGSPAYTLRALRAVRAAAWVGLTGALILLNSLHILTWPHSWPLYIILAGVLGFAERAAQHNAALYPPQGPVL